jgi:hypothetical protein
MRRHSFNLPNIVVRDVNLSVLAGRDAGIDFSFFQYITEPVGVIPAMCFQVSCVNHQRISLVTFERQFHQDVGENALGATIFRSCIPST